MPLTHERKTVLLQFDSKKYTVIYKCNAMNKRDISNSRVYERVKTTDAMNEKIVLRMDDQLRS
jgi:hypothetical protein